MTPQGEDFDEYKTRIRDAERALTMLGLKIAGLEGDMTDVKNAASDFRTFLRKYDEWTGWYKANEINRERREAEEKKKQEDKDKARARIHYWWLGILSALIVAALLTAGSWLSSFFSSHHISSNGSAVSQGPRQDDATLPSSYSVK